MPVRLLYVDDKGREWLVRDGIVEEKQLFPLALGAFAVAAKLLFHFLR